MKYAEWLKNSKLTSTAGNAKKWDSLYNSGKRFGAPAPAAPTPPPAPAAPAFDPKGPLDAEGTQGKNDLDTQNSLNRTRITTNYTSDKADLDAQVPLMKQNWNRNLESNDRNAAARGMMNSGIRTRMRDDSTADFTEGMNAWKRNDARLSNQQQQDLNQSNADYQQGLTNNSINSAARRWDKWREQYGGL